MVNGWFDRLSGGARRDVTKFFRFQLPRLVHEVARAADVRSFRRVGDGKGLALGVAVVNLHADDGGGLMAATAAVLVAINDLFLPAAGTAGPHRALFEDDGICIDALLAEFLELHDAPADDEDDGPENEHGHKQSSDDLEHAGTVTEMTNE